MAQVLHGAHAKDCEVTSLAFSKDDNTLLSRAADDTLKVSIGLAERSARACSRLSCGWQAFSPPIILCCISEAQINVQNATCLSVRQGYRGQSHAPVRSRE